MADNQWYVTKTKNGYLVHEVASAMQKEIRRSNPANAMYWASELLLSGFDKYCWKRLQIIMVEDVDIHQPGLYGDIHALRQTALEGRKERGTKEIDERETLCLMAAVHKLAVAPKARINCNATVFYCQMPRQQQYMLEIPDYALDRHTVKGKQQGRNWNHFFEEGAQINMPYTHEVIDEADPYKDIVIDYLNDKGKYERNSVRQPEGKKDDGYLF